MARKQLSDGLRFAILSRDGFVCVYCGIDAQRAQLHVDHITPVLDGGTNEDTNLVTACASCNLGKGWRALPLEKQESVRQRATPVRPSRRRSAAHDRVFEAALDRLRSLRAVRAVMAVLQKPQMRSIDLQDALETSAHDARQIARALLAAKVLIETGKGAKRTLSVEMDPAAWRATR